MHLHTEQAGNLPLQGQAILLPLTISSDAPGSERPRDLARALARLVWLIVPLLLARAWAGESGLIPRLPRALVDFTGDLIGAVSPADLANLEFTLMLCIATLVWTLGGVFGAALWRARRRG